MRWASSDERIGEKALCPYIVAIRQRWRGI